MLGDPSLPLWDIKEVGGPLSGGDPLWEATPPYLWNSKEVGGPHSGGDLQTPHGRGPPMHVIVWMTSRMLGVPSHDWTGPLSGGDPWTPHGRGPLTGVDPQQITWLWDEGSGDPLTGADQSPHFDHLSRLWLGTGRSAPVRGSVRSCEGSALVRGPLILIHLSRLWLGKGVRSRERTDPLPKINKFLTFDSNSTSDS